MINWQLTHNIGEGEIQSPNSPIRVLECENNSRDNIRIDSFETKGTFLHAQLAIDRVSGDLCPLTCANQMEDSGTELLTREQRLALPPIRSSFMGSISNRPLSLLALAVLRISKSHVYSHKTRTPFVWNGFR